jgi:hypothetical protein
MSAMNVQGICLMMYIVKQASSPTQSESLLTLMKCRRKRCHTHLYTLCAYNTATEYRALSVWPYCSVRLLAIKICGIFVRSVTRPSNNDSKLALAFLLKVERPTLRVSIMHPGLSACPMSYCETAFLKQVVFR